MREIKLNIKALCPREDCETETSLKIEGLAVAVGIRKGLLHSIPVSYIS
jgi:hypothetical protein